MELRASYGCGRVPPRERTDRVRTHRLPMLALDEYDKKCHTPTCPGWLISLPQVHEAVRAHNWAKNGHLSHFYEGADLPRILFDAIDIFDYEVERVKVAIVKEAGDDGRRNLPSGC